MKMFLIVLIVLFSFDLSAKTDLNEKILEEYLKIQKDFNAELCHPGTENVFLKLKKEYRGDGNYIPYKLDGKVDKDVIFKFLPLLESKDRWIQIQINFLTSINNKNNFKKLRFEIDRIENNISLLLEAKKEYFFTKEKEKKNKIQKKSANQFKQIVREFEKFKDNIPFLLSFEFPIDHLELRAEFDKFKSLITDEGRTRANTNFFFRTIVQDGSYDEELSHNDSAIRSAVDTLYLSLNKNKERAFISENERADFNYILKNIEKFSLIKNKILVKRFVLWKERNRRAIAFYREIIKKKKNDDDHSVALYNLKKFVLEKEALTYSFWSKSSDLLQAIFAIETILYSEVGRLDTPDGLERRDIAQIIINRSEDLNYNQLKTTDSLFKYLPSDLETKKFSWLNVLFKEGEFSFTYFYIPGNYFIYCPDMSRVGHFLRQENIKIAIELLNKPRNSYKALRYFSRSGMYGRIEMDSLWKDFKPLPEFPGKLVAGPQKLYDSLKKENYKFLYDFTNEILDKSYFVAEIKGKNYVVDSKNQKQIYYFRNPQQFKYFTSIK